MAQEGLGGAGKAVVCFEPTSLSDIKGFFQIHTKT